MLLDGTVWGMDTEARLMTTDEVAEHFRTVPATVRYWRHIGKGPQSFKVGRRVLYERSDVESWMSSLKNP